MKTSANWLAVRNPGPGKRFLRRFLWLITAIGVVVLFLLGWGGKVLVVSDSLPAHVDAAIVLQGSITAEKARIAGAVSLVQRNVADRVLLSIPAESYWGQSLPPVARAYMERTYGSELAARVDFCETGEDVNSTAEEARALANCIEQHHWQSVAVVTSSYHTRRARMLWRRTTKSESLPIHVGVQGVADPEFQPEWWRRRIYAKTWFMECLKLTWALVGDR
jgi:uncharacterized SAM-binding protein YcdF (DUF218 family)